MNYETKTEYQYFPFIINELEDIQGGGIISRADYKDAADVIPPGALVGIDGKGLYHLCKVAILHANTADDATSYQIKKNHQFRVGNFITCKDEENVKAYAITGVDSSNSDYDILTIGTSLGVALTAGQRIIEVATQDTTGGVSVLRYSPKAITKVEIDAKKENQSSGLLVRGTVKEALMAYPVPQIFKDALPLVRFV